MSGQTIFQKGLEAAAQLRYQRAIADKGVSDFALMQSIGMSEHPDKTLSRGLEEMARERYLRPDSTDRSGV